MSGRDMISYPFWKPTLAAGEGWGSRKQAREAGKRRLQLSSWGLLAWKSLFGDMLWDGGRADLRGQTWDPPAVGCCTAWRVGGSIWVAGWPLVPVAKMGAPGETVRWEGHMGVGRRGRRTEFEGVESVAPTDLQVPMPSNSLDVRGAEAWGEAGLGRSELLSPWGECRRDRPSKKKTGRNTAV